MTKDEYYNTWFIWANTILNLYTLIHTCTSMYEYE